MDIAYEMDCMDVAAEVLDVVQLHNRSRIVYSYNVL